VFSVMLVATVLPLLMYAGVGYHWLEREEQQHWQAHAGAEGRQWGSLLQQRVLGAQALLQALASAGLPASGAVPAVQGTLRGVVVVDEAGVPQAGDAATWQAWQRAPSAEARDGSRAAAALLRWDGAAPGMPDGPVWVAARVGAGLWVAEVEPGYLWAAPPGPATGLRPCITDARQRTLHCPGGSEAVAAAAAGPDESPALRRALYWPATLDAAPWTVAVHAAGPIAHGSDAQLVLRWLVAGAGLTLLVSALVGWLQWRGTAASLDRLIEGTQRWTRQEWDARVHVRAGDVFARLADALNLMAQRIGEQVGAIRVQSAIDREILGGLDTARIMTLVTTRMTTLQPDALAAVVVLGPPGEPWTVHRPGQPASRIAPSDTLPVLPDGEWMGSSRGQRPQPWMAQALPATTQGLWQICWIPALWQGQVMALMLMGSRTALSFSPDVSRELGELRDRIAVTLAAAARETALLERAVNDGLTGLLNRNGLHDAIDAWLAQGTPFTLVLVDLDRFKEVNDTLGHQAGDELLCAVAERLRTCVSPRSQIARPGGDEFVLLLPGSNDEATSAAMAICAELARPFALRGVNQQIGGSLGLAAFPQHAQSRGELMRRADLAMYVSKGEGRGRFSWYASAMDERIARRSWMAQELRLAVDRADFELWFQPRIDAITGEVVGAEALLRWPHAERGFIPPADFVPSAEETGLIDRLGQWVLASAFEQMRRWRAMGLPIQRVAVNVSPRQLRAAGFTDMVLDMLARYGLAPSDVELELTESLFAGDVDAVCEVLEPLRRQGVLLALDDFGTGYSSLSSLYRLPVDVIKIDHSFVRDLGRRPSAEIMARSIVALAKALRKRVVAEGVETRGQRDHLLRLDCDELQGFLFGAPMRVAEFEQRVRLASAAGVAALSSAGVSGGANRPAASPARRG
jgi:diguanylate cyclase (GGDEF)-like protein